MNLPAVTPHSLWGVSCTRQLLLQDNVQQYWLFVRNTNSQNPMIYAAELIHHSPEQRGGFVAVVNASDYRLWQINIIWPQWSVDALKQSPFITDCLTICENLHLYHIIHLWRFSAIQFLKTPTWDIRPVHKLLPLSLIIYIPFDWGGKVHI